MLSTQVVLTWLSFALTTCEKLVFPLVVCELRVLVTALAVGGLKWTRTTDLTLIRRAL